MKIPYDIDSPPAEPPKGCDPLLWKVAYALREEHTAAVDDFCTAASCRHSSAMWPCPKYNLANAALMGSVGGGVPQFTQARLRNQRRT